MKTINTSSAEQANLDKFKAKINGWITTIGLPYHLDDLTPDGGIYTIFCPVVWKELYSAHELKTALKKDVDAEKINIEYIDFKRLMPPKQPLYTTLPAEQQSEELEIEIERYFNDDKWFSTPLGDIARHFAKWQKAQLMKSAIGEYYIKRNKYTKENVLNGLSVTCDAIQKFKDGDKVKVIIVKEDEQ